MPSAIYDLPQTWYSPRKVKKKGKEKEEEEEKEEKKNKKKNKEKEKQEEEGVHRVGHSGIYGWHPKKIDGTDVLKRTRQHVTTPLHSVAAAFDSSFRTPAAAAAATAAIRWSFL